MYIYMYIYVNKKASQGKAQHDNKTDLIHDG